MKLTIKEKIKLFGKMKTVQAQIITEIIFSIKRYILLKEYSPAPIINRVTNEKKVEILSLYK